jgi:hypothetical protein
MIVGAALKSNLCTNDGPIRDAIWRRYIGDDRAAFDQLPATKVTYLFGDLPPTLVAAAEIVAFGRQHAEARDGWVRRAHRPVLLREGILARLPPQEWAADGEIRSRP